MGKHLTIDVIIKNCVSLIGRGFFFFVVAHNIIIVSHSGVLDSIK